MSAARSFFTLGAIALLLGISACEKSEKLYPPPKKIEGIQTMVVHMGEERNNEIWVSLRTGNYSISDGTLWDLSFSCREGQNAIFINTGNDAWVYDADTGAFGEILRAPLVGWQYDKPSGHFDSTGIGKWCGSNHRSYHRRYILDRGMSFTGANRYFKFMLDHSGPDSYELLYGRLDDMVPVRLTVPRISGKNFNYFGFEAGGLVPAEPLDKQDWDIVFRKYKTLLFEEGTGKPYDYIVVGCMLNPYKTRCAETESVEFEKVNRQVASTMLFTNHLDAIGWDWKTYDRVSGKYLINYRKTFIVETSDGRMFKLRFVDYYNDLGQRGYPKMEFQEI